jgi:hypothetical protein
MPSTSKKQANLMSAVAHNPSFAKKVGIPQSVGMDFNKADKGKKFSSEGRPDLQKVAKQKTDHGKMAILKKGGEIMKHDDMKQDMPMMKKVAGIEATKVVNKHEKSMHKMAKGGVTRADGCVSKGHTKGTMIAMKMGGAC